MVLLAVMTAISVAGRVYFQIDSFFKPVTAIVVLTGIYMGPESGFLVGSLSAVISNIFFWSGAVDAFPDAFLGTDRADGGHSRAARALAVQGTGSLRDFCRYGLFRDYGYMDGSQPWVWLELA